MCERFEYYEQCRFCHRKRLLRRTPPRPCYFINTRYPNNPDAHIGECPDGIKLRLSVDASRAMPILRPGTGSGKATTSLIEPHVVTHCRIPERLVHAQ